MTIKGIYLFSVFLLQGSPPFLTLDFGLCARVSPAVFLSPRSNFPLGQRFPISNHMTSGFMSPRSFFTHWSAVSPSKSHDFRFHEPAIPFFPLVSGCLSPPSLFPPGQRGWNRKWRHRKFLWHVIALDQSEARTIAIWAPFTTTNLACDLLVL